MKKEHKTEERIRMDYIRDRIKNAIKRKCKRRTKNEMDQYVSTTIKGMEDRNFHHESIQVMIDYNKQRNVNESESSNVKSYIKALNDAKDVQMKIDMKTQNTNIETNNVQINKDWSSWYNHLCELQEQLAKQLKEKKDEYLRAEQELKKVDFAIEETARFLDVPTEAIQPKNLEE